MPRIESIRLDRIDVAGSFQPRLETSEERAAEYALLRLEGFPPAVIFGIDYRPPFWLADGFTRYRAAEIAGLRYLECDVREGDARAAKFHALGANTLHGYPRTNLDKRRAVATMLADREWGRWSDRDVAKHCAVSHTFVALMRQEIRAGLLSGNGCHLSDNQTTDDSEPPAWADKFARSWTRFRNLLLGGDLAEALPTATTAAGERVQQALAELREAVEAEAAEREEPRPAA